MSAYSTIDITRGKALEMLLEAFHGNISDSVLENFMDSVMEPQLYNCRLVENDMPNEDYLV